MDDHGRPTGRLTLTRALANREFLVRAFRFALHLPTPLHTADREVLENVIFPHFLAMPDIRSVLFVGVAWYTKHYESAFFADRIYWTIDKDRSARKFAGRNHVIASLSEAPSHFPPGCFDLIVCNGVYGHGLDAAEDCERAFAVCYECLRIGGHLVLGWNDVPTRGRCSRTVRCCSR